MKHTIFILILALCLALAAPAACGAEDDALDVVCTIAPLADWTRAVAGEGAPVAVRTLLTGSADMHSHQASAADILALRGCDLLIYVGGESDRWVEEALAQSGGGAPAVLRLMDALADRALDETLLEGMEPADDEDEPGAPDEHIWLSLKNARVCCGAIRDALKAADPAGADGYDAAFAAYDAELLALDGAYEAAVTSAKRRTLLFGDRYPFRYLAEDYGLTCYAAFPGCSAETEASFATVVFLATKCDELDLPCVMTIEGGDQALARTIARSTASGERKILTLDSMQGAAAPDKTYLDVMKSNLGVLEDALN